MKVVRFPEIKQSETALLFVGRDHGANVSFFIINCRRGEGPDPHRHPYEETFVVLEGATDFTVEGETVHVEGGNIVVAPAGLVHSFRGASGGVTRQVNIHPAAEMMTEWIQ